ncbi:MAG TPA: aldehyde dehydrogenase family protein, partial [Myxococcota bacterium]|nr:aldehyde dehydrogenase family protein [Myxococcota bacterium]
MIDLARVRAAQRKLATAKAESRTEALAFLADIMREQDAAIDAANQRDLAAAADLEPQLKSRLALDAKKRAGLIEGLKQLVASPDPIDVEVSRTKLDDGLMLTKVRSPIGVVLVIFESRPDAVIQIASLAVRSGNAVVLKGGSEATHSNRILVDCVRKSLERAGLDADAVMLVEGRAAVQELLSRGDVIDLVIPRGSGQLVRSIQEGTRIPVLGHAEGICHLYIDAKADPAMAVQLAVDGKCDYPSACNATETILVHEAFLPHIGR